MDASRFDPGAVQGLDAFSHLEVVLLFDRGDLGMVRCGPRRPVPIRSGRRWESSPDTVPSGQTGSVPRGTDRSSSVGCLGHRQGRVGLPCVSRPGPRGSKRRVQKVTTHTTITPGPHARAVHCRLDEPRRPEGRNRTRTPTISSRDTYGWRQLRESLDAWRLSPSRT